MESIISWFQDWSDACVYAKECAPDLSFLPGEPFTALASIAAVCFLIWWRNEHALSAYLVEENVEADRSASDDLADVLHRARELVSAPAKKAA